MIHQLYRQRTEYSFAFRKKNYVKRNKKTNIIDRIAVILFLLSAGVFVFGYGVMVGKYKFFPYSIWADMEIAFRVATGLYEKPGQKSIHPNIPHHLSPAYYDYAGVRIYDAGAMARGVTLLTSYWHSLNWRPGIRLIDSTGKILHHWKVDPAEIWPVSPHSDYVGRRKNTSDNYIHGCYLFDNGDVIFNVEYMGMVRMNADGKVLWTLPYRTHHSVHRGDDGHFWVCGLKWIKDNPEGRARLAQFPGLNLPVAEDFALKVSEEGEILREISILKVLYLNGYQQLIRQMSGGRSNDILHTNDIEPLSYGLANRYPLFNAGDILVSCRYLNAIFVMDPETEKIKWMCSRFLQQHDPDFLKDGWICVFDNNTDGSDQGQYPGGSQIVAVKPGRNQIRMLYPKTGEQEFYTAHGGKIQYCANGNLLITESRRGRVFETDPSGRTVWEWVQERFNDKLIPEVLEGTRYNLTAEQVAEW